MKTTHAHPRPDETECERLSTLGQEWQARALVAEAKVARVEALAAEWDARYGPYPNGFCHSLTIHEVTGSLRHALLLTAESRAMAPETDQQASGGVQ